MGCISTPAAVYLSCLITGFIFSSCVTKHQEEKTGPGIAYPHPLPDSVPRLFLPDVVSKESRDFNAAFSPDGRSFYFSRSAGNRSGIYITHYTGERWTEPEAAPFTAAEHSDADPAFGYDGKLYFISTRPKDASDTLPDYDIWFTSPLADGRWSEPENMKAINSDSAEFYISFSENGNLYFASSRKGGLGEEDIYVSRLINNEYSEPENLGASINSQRSEYDPGISAKEDLIVFTSSNREDTFGAGDLYCSRPGADKKWQRAVNLGSKFNTATREYCAYFSPDSKYFFFSSEGDVKWISTKALLEQCSKLWQP